MADQFELLLARRLGDYADARVRPSDPMRIATAAVAAKPVNRNRWLGSMGLTRRWLVPLAAGALLLGGVTVGAWIGRQTPPPVASPAPSASGSAAPSGAAVDLRRSILETGSWELEFALSHLDGHVDPTLDREIGSYVQFRDRRFEGGTGYGGGCDHFDGNFEVHDQELRITFRLIQQGCDKGSPQEIVDRLVVTQRDELHNCTGPLDGAIPSAGTTCDFLYLLGPLADQLLVYHHLP